MPCVASLEHRGVERDRNSIPVERLEIIFETADRFPGQIAFDVSVKNARYIDHSNDKQSPERLKLSSDIEGTAIREGYRWVPGVDESVRRFVSAFPHAAAAPRPIVDAFRDQGYDVEVRCGYESRRCARARCHGGDRRSAAFCGSETRQFLMQQTEITRWPVDMEAKGDADFFVFIELDLRTMAPTFYVLTNEQARSTFRDYVGGGNCYPP